MKILLEDSVSFGLSLAAFSIPLYLATFVGFHTLLLIPSFMLLGGLVFQWYISKKVVHDESFSFAETKDTILYTLIALAGIGLGSIVTPNLFKPSPLPFETASSQMQVAGPFLYGQFYAISEERMFRGAWTLFFRWKLGNNPFLVAPASGGIFMIFHFAVYGTSPSNLAYVAVAGTILAVSTLRSGRLTSSILAHMINNALV